MIERAEQLHRQFFQPGFSALPRTGWEPPIDVFQGEHDLLIVVALPGVESQDIAISTEPGALLVAGIRRLPAAARGTEILRVEIPHGRFERRIALPPARWELARSAFVNGCLLINLTKQA